MKSREITSTEGNTNDVVEFIEMKIAQLKLKLAFHKKHQVKN